MQTSGALLALVLAGLFLGCGAKVVVDDRVACVHFSDPERSVPNGPAPTDMECALEPGLEARFAKAGIPTSITPKSSKWTLNLVCTSFDANGQCPNARAAASDFTSCLATQKGEGCNAPLSGECDRQFVWSACGPDPSTLGGCCYEVLVAESDVLS